MHFCFEPINRSIFQNKLCFFSKSISAQTLNSTYMLTKIIKLILRICFTYLKLLFQKFMCLSSCLLSLGIYIYTGIFSIKAPKTNQSIKKIQINMADNIVSTPDIGHLSKQYKSQANGRHLNAATDFLLDKNINDHYGKWQVGQEYSCTPKNAMHFKEITAAVLVLKRTVMW